MDSRSLISQARNRGTFKAINLASEVFYSSGDTTYYKTYNKVRGVFTFSTLSGGERNISRSKDSFPIAYGSSNTVQEASYL